MLASMAKLQLESQKLLAWKEQQFIQRMKEDFGYEIPRDKSRHDLVDRLVGQGFMRKWANVYFLTVKGLARYLYCLAKYTTTAMEEPSHVTECLHCPSPTYDPIWLSLEPNEQRPRKRRNLQWLISSMFNSMIGR